MGAVDHGDVLERRVGAEADAVVRAAAVDKGLVRALAEERDLGRFQEGERLERSFREADRLAVKRKRGGGSDGLLRRGGGAVAGVVRLGRIYPEFPVFEKRLDLVVAVDVLDGEFRSCHARDFDTVRHPAEERAVGERLDHDVGRRACRHNLQFRSVREDAAHGIGERVYGKALDAGALVRARVVRGVARVDARRAGAQAQVAARERDERRLRLVVAGAELRHRGDRAGVRDRGRAIGGVGVDVGLHAVEREVVHDDGVRQRAVLADGTALRALGGGDVDRVAGDGGIDDVGLVAVVFASAAGHVAAHERAAADGAVVAVGAVVVPDLAVDEVAVVEADAVEGEALERRVVVVFALDVALLLEDELRVGGAAGGAERHAARDADLRAVGRTPDVGAGRDDHRVEPLQVAGVRARPRMLRRAVGGVGIGGGVHVPVAADVDLPRDGVRPALVRDGAPEDGLVVRILHLVERLRRLEDEVRLRADGHRRPIVVVRIQELPLHVEGIARLVRNGHVERGGVAEVEEDDRVRVGGREGVDHGRAVRVADDGEAVEVGGDAHVVRAGTDGEPDVACLAQHAGEDRAVDALVGIPVVVLVELKSGGEAVGFEDDVSRRDAVGHIADIGVVAAFGESHADRAIAIERVAVLPVGVADRSVALERDARGPRAGAGGERLEAERHLVRDVRVHVSFHVGRVAPERRDARVVVEIGIVGVGLVDAGVLEEQEPMRADVYLVVCLAGERERERQGVFDVAGALASFPEGRLVRRDLVGARGGRPGGVDFPPLVGGLVAALDEEGLVVWYALHAVRQRGRRDGEVVRECGSERREHRGRKGQYFFHGNVPIDKAYACSRLLSTVFDENMLVMVVDFIAAIRFSDTQSGTAVAGNSPTERHHNIIIPPASAIEN